MKTLLLLGGSHFLKPVVECARGLGLYVITCDYLPDNYAHHIADKYVNASILDRERILSEARQHHIDGIMSFATDPGVVTACYVANQLGLPCVGSVESTEILQNKLKYRTFLKENGFNVPEFAVCDHLSDYDESIKYPVIVKPNMSAGSKGVAIVYGKENIERAFEIAKDTSLDNRVIIEEYIEPLYHPSDADCFSVDGELVYVAFNNQLFDKNSANPFTPAAFSWETDMPVWAQEECKAELQRLISLLHLGTSLYNVECRVGKNGKLYLMEVSPRGGGNRLAEMQDKIYGSALIENAIRAAVGMPLGPFNKRKNDGLYLEVILHSNQSGKFKELFIDDSIKPNVQEIDLWVNQGEKIEPFTGANKTIGTMVLQFDTKEQQDYVMAYFDEVVKVLID